ncbi:MAG: hypothetical protein R3D57_16355 [Hyphomicrobiaceae bacterium]
MAWFGTLGASEVRPRKRELLRDFSEDDSAAMSVEYALIAVVLCGCLFLALPLVSTELAETFTIVAGHFATILGG